MVEAFDKILDHALTKVCNANRDGWDLKIPTVLWAYCTTSKRFMGQTPFKLVYGKEAGMPVEYIVPNLCIETATGLDDEVVLEECMAQLIQLKEDPFYRNISSMHRERLTEVLP